MRKAILLLGILAGCSSLNVPKPTGEATPPPGISYRIKDDDTSQAFAQAQDYCKRYGTFTAKLDRVENADGQGEKLAMFSCK
jgi:hypothetical protein